MTEGDDARWAAASLALSSATREAILAVADAPRAEVQWANENALALFGCERAEELLGRPVIERFERGAETLQSLLEPAKPEAGQRVEVLAVDGHSFFVEASAARFSEGGQPLVALRCRRVPQRAERVRRSRLPDVRRDVAIAAGDLADSRGSLAVALEAILEVTGWECGYALLIPEDEGEELQLNGDVAVHAEAQDPVTIRRWAEGGGYRPEGPIRRRSLAIRSPLWLQPSAADLGTLEVRRPRASDPIEEVELADEGFWRGAINAGVALHSVFDFPICAGDRSLGVLEFLSLRAGEPIAEVWDAIVEIAAQVGRAVQRSRFERAAKAREEHFRLLEERSEVGFITVGGDLENILYASPNLDRVTGYPRERFYDGDPLWWTQTVPEERRREVVQSFLGVREGKAVDLETPYLLPDGRLRWAWIRATPLLDDDNQVERVVVTVTDASERHEITEQLRRSEALFRQVADNIDIVTYVMDSSMEQIFFVNSGFERIYGIPVEEVYADASVWLEAIVLDDVSVVTQAVAEVARSGDGRHVQYRFRRRLDGALRYAWATMEPVRDELGAVTRIVGTVSDITGRVESEERLKQATAAARQADEAKSAFLASMSHEIRTPMNAIIGMASVLLNTSLDSRQVECAEAIRSSSGALLAIINDILDISKIEAGGLTLEEAGFDLRTCIESAVDLLGGQAAAKDLELAYEMDASCPEGLRGDVTRLRQILVNLLGNAIKFTERGEVVVRVTRITPAEEEASDLVPGSPVDLHFAVRDTGVGIPADRVEAIFDSFAQADASTTRKHGGTGLGLTISRRLARMMGGSLWCESSGVSGEGSTFHFTIRAEVAEVEGSLAAVDMGPLAGKRALLIVDSPRLRTRLDEQLCSWGIETTALSSDRVAEDMSMLSLPDLVLIDESLDSRDATSLFRLLHRFEDEAGLPIVLLCRSLPEDARSDDSGAISFVRKPVRQSSLFDAVATSLAPALFAGLFRRESEFDCSLGERWPLRILAVDDSTVNQKVLLHLLEHMGYRADVAADGREAVAAVHRQVYDLVLMDIEMPLMDGIEATLEIRSSLPPERQPHIIALTADAVRTSRQDCLDAGVNDYLTKPVDVAVLQAAVERTPVASADAAPPPPPSIREAPAAPPSGGALNRLGTEAILARLQDILAVEVAEQMELLDAGFEKLRQGEAEAEPEAYLKTMKRAAHTIKGGAGSAGREDLETLARELEGILSPWVATPGAEVPADEREKIGECLERLRPLATSLTDGRGLPGGG